MTLGDRCTIGPGAVVRDSSLHDGVTVAEGAVVRGQHRAAPASRRSGTAGGVRDPRVKQREGYEISTDPERLDRDLIHRFLRDDSYWARGIPREVLDRAIANSLCFGLYDHAGAASRLRARRHRPGGDRLSRRRVRASRRTAAEGSASG